MALLLLFWQLASVYYYDSDCRDDDDDNNNNYYYYCAIHDFTHLHSALGQAKVIQFFSVVAIVVAPPLTNRLKA